MSTSNKTILHNNKKDIFDYLNGISEVQEEEDYPSLREEADQIFIELDLPDFINHKIDYEDY